MKLDFPNPSEFVGDDGELSVTAVAFLSRIMNRLVAGTQSGTTAQRPNLKGKMEIGISYFDTTLGKAVWLKSVSPQVWVDGAGTVV